MHSPFPTHTLVTCCKAVRTLSQEGLVEDHQTLCVGEGHTRVHVTSGWWELHWEFGDQKTGEGSGIENL